MLSATLGHLGRAVACVPQLTPPFSVSITFPPGPRGVDVFLSLCVSRAKPKLSGVQEPRQVPHRVAQQPEERGRSCISCSGAFSFKRGKNLGGLAEDSPSRPALEEAGPPPRPLRTVLPLALTFPKSENPFRLWEKPHKKGKAQPKGTLVSIYNPREGISHRFNSCMKKQPVPRGRMCFPFPTRADALVTTQSLGTASSKDDLLIGDGGGSSAAVHALSTHLPCPSPGDAWGTSGGLLTSGWGWQVRAPRVFMSSP